MSLLKKIGKVVGKVTKVAGKLAKGDVLGAVGTAVGAIAGSKGAKKAAKASSAGYDAAVQVNRNALADVNALQTPYSDLGGKAIGQINNLNSGDYSGFQSSPDYLFAQQQGGRAVDRSAAARGGLNSGNTLVAQQRFGQGLASEQLNAYRNSLFNTLNVGQRAADMRSGAATGTASNIGNLLVGGADARASGIVGSTNAITGGIEDLAGLAGDAIGNSLVKKPKAKTKMALNVKLPTAQRAV